MNNKVKEISIVMSVKNGERFLNNAIKSILNQSFKNFEFIIVNNDSHDKTQDILISYQKKESRIKVLTNSNNETLYEGRTKAINFSNLEWFALMDADDECHQDRIKKQIEYINHTPYENLAILSTYGKYINSKGKIIANKNSGPTNLESFNKIYKNNDSFSILDPSIVVKKKAFFEVGGYLKNNIAADLDLSYKIAEAGYLIQTINTPLYYYRIHETSYSVQNSLKQCEVTHFINYNMRKRRSGQIQISEEKFYEEFWNKFFYRIPRKILDYSKTFYKISAHLFIQKKYFSSLINLFIAFIFSPRHVFKRLIYHFFN